MKGFSLFPGYDIWSNIIINLVDCSVALILDPSGTGVNITYCSVFPVNPESIITGHIQSLYSFSHS